jgi:hypothetical protein
MKTEYLYIGAAAGLVLVQDIGAQLGVPSAVSAIPPVALLALAGIVRGSVGAIALYGAAVGLFSARAVIQQSLSKKFTD